MLDTKMSSSLWAGQTFQSSPDDVTSLNPLMLVYVMSPSFSSSFALVPALSRTHHAYATSKGRHMPQRRARWLDIHKISVCTIIRGS